MTADVGPWWHSRDDALGNEDPLAQHVGARATGANDQAPGDETGQADGPDRAELPHDPPCDVCPICRGIEHVRRTHPEVAAHLVEAARHLTRAVSELLDEVATRRPDGSTSAAADNGFTAIRLDDQE